MRYYKIVIVRNKSQSSTSSNGGATATAAKTLTFTTHPNGVSSAADMGALHVIFDLPATAFNAPNGAAYIEIRGVDITTISQASNLQGATIKIYGGMGKGLPLADPSQSGLLLSGSVYQAFGNWLDADMSLNLMVQPFSAPVSDTNVPNFVWNWQKGTSLTDALTQAIKTGMPGYTCDFKGITNNLSSTYSCVGFYPDIFSFAQVVQSDTEAQNTAKGYQGVRFYISGTTFYFYDTASSATPKKLKFTDLIGQPTWLGPVDFPKIMFQTVMRADIGLNDVVTMPVYNQNGSTNTLATYGTIAPSSTNITTPKGRSLFQGNFCITSIRHIGDSRNPDGASWVSVYEAVAV